MWNRRKEQQNNLTSILKKKSRNYSFSEVCEKVQIVLNEYTSSSISEIGLSEELRRNQEEHRRVISSSIRTCCAGNYGAKETVKEIIKDYLLDELQVDRTSICSLVAFDTPERMSAWQMAETMIYCMDKKEEERGFGLLCEMYQWGNFQEESNTGYFIAEEVVRKTYESMKPELSFMEQISIVAQLIFAKTVGLGVIDTLNQQRGYIEEIQLGMNGRSEQRYDYKEELSGRNKLDFFSRDGVHILVKGSTIWLQYLSFGTEEELQRVLRNLIKESSAGELTKNHPMIVVDTIDGRRVSVSRPPMTDAWVGLIRKFDTVEQVSLEKLYQNTSEADLLVGLLRQLVRSGRNIAITGEMASGKTTLFRACLAETRRDLNIRVIEADSFELNVRGFLPKANSMTMRVTDRTPAEEVLAFARKTTGQIFAVGEINSAAVATMAMDLSKIASQLLFSAHYVTTEHMIADFVNAKLCVGGYSEESLAEMDVVRCLGFDIHLKARQGKRYVQYINEVVPVKERKERNSKTYQIRQIYRYDEEQEKGMLLCSPGELSYEKAKQGLSKDKYTEFCCFFEQNITQKKFGIEESQISCRSSYEV